MRRFVLAAAFAFLAAVPAAAANFSDAQKADLKRISDYLNMIQSAQGRFVQIGPDGKSDEGTFYLKKPGRVRFEYRAPNPNLIVSDGTTIAVENAALKTTNRYPLLSSPLKLLLSDKVDLASDPRIVSLTREAGTLTVTARQNDGPAKGQITLTFADTGTGLELRQWEVLDAQNLRTLVALTDLREDTEISPRLFVIHDLSPFQKRKD